MSRRASRRSSPDDAGGKGRPAQPRLPRHCRCAGRISARARPARSSTSTAPRTWPAPRPWRARRASRSRRSSGSTCCTASARSFRSPRGGGRLQPAPRRLPAEWSAKEAARSGVQWTYAPMADLSRDIRWGRIVEGFGEDPHLGSVSLPPGSKASARAGSPTAAKHFVGYGAPMGGRDYDTTHIPARRTARHLSAALPGRARRPER